MNNENYNEYVGKRIVITTIGNITFAGKLIKTSNENNENGLFIQTDSRFGVCIWCPVSSVKEIITIPAINDPEEKKND